MPEPTSSQARPTAEPLVVDSLRGICSIEEFRGDDLPPEVSVPHRHGFYELLWLHSGGGTFHNDFSADAVRPGTLIYVHRGSIHRWKLESKVRGYVIRFSEDFLLSEPSFVKNFTADSAAVVDLPPSKHAHLMDIFEQMRLEQQTKAPFWMDSFRARLLLLLIEHRRLAALAVDSTGDKGVGRIAREFLNRVEQNFKTQHRPTQYAEQLDLSAYSFTKLIRSETGEPPIVHIRNRQILEAKRLLLHSSLNVAGIAYELGFPSPSNFGRFFKTYVGKTPGDWKKAEKASPH